MKSNGVKKLLQRTALILIPIGLVLLFTVKVLFPLMERLLDSMVANGMAMFIPVIPLALLGFVLGWLIGLPNNPQNK